MRQLARRLRSGGRLASEPFMNSELQYFYILLITGVTKGSIYALIALGYTMVYGIIELINFAHGEIYMIGAFTGLIVSGLLGFLGFPLLGILCVAVVCAVIWCAAYGYTIEKVAYRPLRNSSRLSAVVSALGASIFFQNAIMLVYGTRYQVYASDLRPSGFIPVMGLEIPVVRFYLFGSSVLLMLLLYWFINKTRIGMAIRAVAIDQQAARLMGIDVNRIIALVFLIGPALGGIAGVMVGLYYGQIRYDMGLLYGLKAFIAAILGGIGNIPGAMIGGILLGVIEALGAAYVSVAWKDAIAFLVLILILIFRPTGLLGERVADKI